MTDYQLPGEETEHVTSSSFPGYSLSFPREILKEVESHRLLAPLLPLETGLFQRAAGHGIFRRGLDEYVLIYCTDGRGYLEMEGRKHLADRGTLLICPPDIPHRYWADRASPWTIYWVHFKGESAPFLLEQLEMTPASPCRKLGVKGELVKEFLELNRRFRGGHGLPHLYRAASALQELLSQMVLYGGYAAVWEEGKLDMDALLGLMERDPGRNLSLDDLARGAGMSKYHFSRKFRRALGESPMAYYKQLKIRRACELLDTTGRSIKEISAALGFATPYYFSETFKRITGYSPTGYRRERMG